MQPNLTSNTYPRPTASSGYRPTGLLVDGPGNLWAADTYNNRVLIYEGGGFPSHSFMNASAVFGQPNLTSAVFGNTENLLNNPVAMAIDSTRKILYVTGSYATHHNKHNHTHNASQMPPITVCRHSISLSSL